MNKLILLLFFCSILTLPAFAISIDEMKHFFTDEPLYIVVNRDADYDDWEIVERDTDYTQPLVIGEKKMITADDGTKMILQKLNPCFSQGIPYDEFMPDDDVCQEVFDSFTYNVYTEKFAVLLTEDEKEVIHIMSYFCLEPDFKIEIKKYKDYDNVTAYTIHDPNNIDETSELYGWTEFIWVDKHGNNNSAGMDFMEKYTRGWEWVKTDDGQGYYSYDTITQKAERYYEYIKDFIYDYLNAILTKEDIMQHPGPGAYHFYYFMELYDSSDEAMSLLDSLYEMAKIDGTKELLIKYTLPVSLFLKYYPRYEGLDDPTERPDIAEELPADDTELVIYQEWMLSFFYIISLTDCWDNQINFEVVPEGLKAISAGPDGEFGTDDDIIYISRYDDANNDNDYSRLFP